MDGQISGQTEGRAKGGEVDKSEGKTTWDQLGGWVGEWMSNQDNFLHMVILRRQVSGISPLECDISRKTAEYAMFKWVFVGSSHSS